MLIRPNSKYNLLLTVIRLESDFCFVLFVLFVVSFTESLLIRTPLPTPSSPTQGNGKA